MNMPQLGSITGLLIIDVQERLMTAMPESARDHVVRQIETLALLADAFGSSTWITEQYPKGLGPTVETLAAFKATSSCFEKTHFDACANDQFSNAMVDLPDTVVVCGMETHICVLSTVLSLRATGRRVIVPFDGVLSRFETHHRNGLDQMKHAGADISNTESLVFATLKDSKSEHFKQFSKRIQ